MLPNTPQCAVDVSSLSNGAGKYQLSGISVSDDQLEQRSNQA